MGFEYARFGAGFVRRTEGSDESWMSCAHADVPPEFFEKEERTEARRKALALGGSDPFASLDVPEGAVLVSTPGSRVGAVRLANPVADAIAGELGLSPDQLRGRLNGAPGGTNARVSEARFDEIAVELGLDPKDARDRFADR